MKIINLILASFCMMVFSACKKEDNTIYTISGHFYHDCNVQPVSNFKVMLFEDANNGSGKGGLLATTYTDSSGYFKFEFKDKKGNELIFQCVSGAGYRNLMSGIPLRTSIDNLVVYYNPTTNIQLCLNVINPHTASDTLHISDFTDFTSTTGYLAIGPFSSGVLYTATNFPLLTMYYNGQDSRITWWFNQYKSSYENQDFTISKYCNDTIFVTATIK